MLLKSYILTFNQFVLIFIFLISGNPLCSNHILLSVEISGILLGLWSIATMGIHNLSITPHVKENTVFKNTGPYQLIRHPMYFSIIITFIPILINYYSLLRLIVFILLLVNLVLKLNFEEKQLTRKFENYHSYKNRTYRLIPFVY